MVWTITSQLVPELVTEIDELEHLHACVYDVLGAVMELYQDMGKEFSANLRADMPGVIGAKSLFLNPD